MSWLDSIDTTNKNAECFRREFATKRLHQRGTDFLALYCVSSVSHNSCLQKVVDFENRDPVSGNLAKVTKW